MLSSFPQAGDFR